MKCNLCSRKCNVDRDISVGICGASNKIKVARASLHMWEEPCISGDNGSGTIFFSYCNLQCIYCQNYELSKNHLGKEISVLELSDICLDLQSKGANNINLVTPTHYVPEIIEALKIAKSKGLSIPIVYNTSSYENIDTIKMLDGIIDIYLPDLKYYDDYYAINYSHVKDYFKVASQCIDEMYRQVGKPEFNDDGIMTKGVIVRHLCLPGLKDDSKKILEYLYNTYHNDIYISIMNQYTPVRKFNRFKNLNNLLSEDDYDEIIDYALDIGITKAFIQEGETQKESFIPDFHQFEENKNT